MTMFEEVQTDVVPLKPVHLTPLLLYLSWGIYSLKLRTVIIYQKLFQRDSGCMKTTLKTRKEGFHFGGPTFSSSSKIKVPQPKST